MLGTNIRVSKSYNTGKIIYRVCLPTSSLDEAADVKCSSKAINI